MAYASKYYLDQYSNQGVHYYINLLKDGFVGTSTKLKLGSISIDYDLAGWGENVMTLVTKLVILNDASNWYAYEDLFTLEDKEFKMVIDASYGNENITLFDGWINSAPVVQKYLNNSFINITGSNFISKMDKLSPPILDITDASHNDSRSFIDLINASLQLTGKIDDILVNCSLEPSVGISSTTTAFNKCSVDPQIFYVDNTNRESGLDIINDILLPFNSYLYWWNGDWYVERYRDLFTLDGSKNYVRYSYPTQDVSFWYDSTGVAVEAYEPSINLPISTCDTSILFTSSSQTISMIPGLEFIEIDLLEEPVLNLTQNDFLRIDGTDDTPQIMYPTYRGWQGTQYPAYTGGTGIDFPGYRADSTEPSIGYSFYEEKTLTRFVQTPFGTSNYTTGPGNTYRGIQNAIMRFDVPYYYVAGVFSQKLSLSHGISTRIKVTIESTETKMNLSWKYYPVHVDVNESFDRPRTWDYRCRWTLRVPDSSFYWIKEITTGDEPYWEYDYDTNYQTYTQYKIVEGGDLNESGYADISIDIPIGDVSGWITTGSSDLVFTIWGEEIRKTGETLWRSNDDDYVLCAVYGDVIITGDSGAEGQKNKIIAQLNKNVLNNEKVSMKIYDNESYLVSNGVQTGLTYEDKTTIWNEDGETIYRSLVDWYIHDRYQLYNSNRREITGTIRYPGYIKPMSNWYDSYDPSTKRYVLTSYSYDIQGDTYNVKWLEYDNTTVINMNSSGRPPRSSVTPATSRSPRPTGVTRSSGRIPATSTSTEPRTVGDRTTTYSVPRER